MWDAAVAGLMGILQWKAFLLMMFGIIISSTLVAMPFIALIIVLAGLTMIAQVYFTKPNGTVTVQGDGLQFTFQFQGDTAQREIFDVVNTAFATRQTKLEEEVQLETADSVSPWESTSPSP